MSAEPLVNVSELAGPGLMYFSSAGVSEVEVEVDAGGTGAVASLTMMPTEAARVVAEVMSLVEVSWRLGGVSVVLFDSVVVCGFVCACLRSEG